MRAWRAFSPMDLAAMVNGSAVTLSATHTITVVQQGNLQVSIDGKAALMKVGITRAGHTSGDIDLTN
jgi:hypothetical protein